MRTGYETTTGWPRNGSLRGNKKKRSNKVDVSSRVEESLERDEESNETPASKLAGLGSGKE